MEPVKNLNDKRVCDISHDRKVVEIVQKGCLTRITANPDGTLKVENVPWQNPNANFSLTISSRRGSKEVA